jgi:hypothetical protein
MSPITVSPSARGPLRSLEKSRVLLRGCLDGRRAEIEQATIARVYAISDPRESQDPDYIAGLRDALTHAIDYALKVIERGEEHAPPIPPTLLTQARMAARNGIGLDTVLRRYLAGYSLLSEFVIQEAEGTSLLGGVGLQRLLRGQAAVLDQLIAEVSEEYCRESKGRTGSAERRRAERVERLLAGELLDASELRYDLDVHHLGAIAQGNGSEEALRSLVASFDARLLLIHREDGTVWAWFGSRRGFAADDVAALASSSLPSDVSVAFGEPAEGLLGWRLSHRQAAAALTVAKRTEATAVRYADVAFLAAALRDDLLATSLRCLYLQPLEADRDGGKLARETLRAYFSSGRNASSAASALRLNRRTVTNRLRAIEESLGRPLVSCAMGLEAALGLDELSGALSTLPI